MHIDPMFLLTKLSANKTSSFEFQRRRHMDWTENYQLYRDKVIINRLTQRQSVNVPLMKETLRTIISRVDDAPDLAYESLANDKDKEIFLNEYWKYCVRKSKLVLKDIVDKKQVLLYGRSFKKLSVVSGEFYCEVLEPFDVLVDRFADPADIDTAQHIIHQHIYRTLSQLTNNPLYDKEAINRMKANYATAAGILKASENLESMMAKNERLRSMGVPDIDNPLVGEVYVELNEHYVKLFDPVTGKNEIYVCSVADGELLQSRPLEEILGKTKDNYWQKHFPIVSWADDLERTDVWSDGTADIVRTPNKILNSWFAQLAENRTMRNFGMQFYDTTAGENGFVPQTVDPVPFGWYGVPGDPNKIVKRVDIEGLEDSFESMQFVINMVERATAATATEKGEQSKGQITLGEIKLISDKALERITSMSKFYRESYYEFGEKWYKMVEAQRTNLKAAQLYKKSAKGNHFEKSVTYVDWYEELGYVCKVTSSAEQEEESLQTIQKLQAVVAQFPDNAPLDKIYKKKLLELGKLTPEEIREVMDAEAQKNSATGTGGIMEALKAAGMGGSPGGGGGVPTPTPGQPVPTPAVAAQ